MSNLVWPIDIRHWAITRPLFIPIVAHKFDAFAGVLITGSKWSLDHVTFTHTHTRDLFTYQHPHQGYNPSWNRRSHSMLFPQTWMTYRQSSKTRGMSRSSFSPPPTNLYWDHDEPIYACHLSFIAKVLTRCLLILFLFGTFPFLFQLRLSLFLELLDFLHDFLSNLFFTLLWCIKRTFSRLDLFAVYNMFLF